MSEIALTLPPEVVETTERFVGRLAGELCGCSVIVIIQHDNKLTVASNAARDARLEILETATAFTRRRGLQ